MDLKNIATFTMRTWSLLLSLLLLLQDCQELIPFEFNDDSPSGLEVGRPLFTLHALLKSSINYDSSNVVFSCAVRGL